MSINRLQVGIDFSHKSANLCLLASDGQAIAMHQPFGNTQPGYLQAKQFMLDTIQAYSFDGLDVSGEATSYYWLPFFLRLANDPDLARLDLSLFLLNPRWVH
jgi:hypothetical protein